MKCTFKTLFGSAILLLAFTPTYSQFPPTLQGTMNQPFNAFGFGSRVYARFDHKLNERLGYRFDTRASSIEVFKGGESLIVRPGFSYFAPWATFGVGYSYGRLRHSYFHSIKYVQQGFWIEANRIDPIGKWSLDYRVRFEYDMMDQGLVGEKNDGIYRKLTPQFRVRAGFERRILERVSNTHPIIIGMNHELCLKTSQDIGRGIIPWARTMMYLSYLPSERMKISFGFWRQINDAGMAWVSNKPWRYPSTNPMRKLELRIEYQI